MAVVTAAIFRGRNIALLLAGFLAPWLMGAGFTASASFGLVAFVAGIGMSAGEPRFLALVQARRRLRLAPGPGAPGGLPRAATVAPVLLTGRHRASFDRVSELAGELEREVAALPQGPLIESVQEFLPELSNVVPELAKLLTQAQRAESGSTGEARALLEKEVVEVEARLAAATDPEVEHQLSTAVARKREALGHLASAGSALVRIEAQVEAIASGLQEARARLAALAAETGSLDAGPARQAVEGVSRDVKFLAQAVEETERLLIAPKEDPAWDSGRGSSRSSLRT